MNKPEKKKEQDRKKGKILPINRFLPARTLSSPFEKAPEQEVQQAPEPVSDAAFELIKKIAADVEELKSKICDDQGNLKIIMVSQDASLPDDLLKQLKGEKIKLGSADQEGIIVGDMDRFLLTPSKGNGFYFFDEIAKYPSPHMVTLGPTGSGMHNIAKTPEESARVRAAADYGLKVIEKMQTREATEKYNKFLRAAPLTLDNIDIETEDTQVLKDVLKTYELMLKREKRMLDVDNMLIDPRNDPAHNSLLENGVSRYQESADRIEKHINRIKAELEKRGVQEL